jgi:hypothetical protein
MKAARAPLDDAEEPRLSYKEIVTGTGSDNHLVLAMMRWQSMR